MSNKIAVISLFCGLFLLIQNALAMEIVSLRVSKTEFNHPHDLVLDAQGIHVYVADMNNNVVKVLHPDTLQVLARIGENELNAPHDVAFDAQGRLLVADSGNNRIAIYQLSDALTATMVAELKQEMNSPEGVSGAPDGSIYVANAGNDKILKFKDGALIKQAGGTGSSAGRFKRAHDIEYFSDKLYVADPGNNRIQVLDASLNSVAVFVAQNKAFNEPKYLSLDLQGRLYVADQYNNALRIFSGSQELIVMDRSENVSLDRIEGVAVRDSRIWVADTYNNRIVLYHSKQ